jgi:signal transduction histidine kinase
VAPADAALAGGIAVLSLISFMERASLLFETADGPVHYAAPDLLGAVQVLAGCVALAWRRSFSGIVLAVCVVSAIGRYAEHYPVMPLPYAVLVAVYTVAQRWTLRRSLVAAGVVAAGLGASAMVLLSPSLDDEPMTEVVAVATAWALGRGVQMRQVRAGLLEERARLLEDSARQLAHEQRTVAELSAARERARIARELHDIVANNVSVIVAQAGAARRAASSADDERAASTLRTIETLGRETLRDMRRLVGVLHTTAGEESVARRLPRLHDLSALAATMTAAGTPVALAVRGTPRELPTVVELNAYRIVQESLTNAMKHAPRARVEVTVDYQSALLRLRIRDFGQQPPDPGSPGSGLIGMRQRVALLGGTLEAGPLSGGGFCVDARVPLPAGDSGGGAA